MEREFLKKSGSVLCQGKSVRYTYMEEHKNTYPITIMARLLKISISRFYDWLKRGVSKIVVLRNQQTILVKITHQETKESYGHIRLTRSGRLLPTYKQ